MLQLYAFLAAIADPVRKLSSVYTKIQSGGAAANRVFESVRPMPTVQANAEGPRIDGVRKDSIEFRNVCFSYNPGLARRRRCDFVNLTVKAGETIAIVGPNGCGKTTLLGLLPRFYDPDHGAVLIDGVEHPHGATFAACGGQIGIVTQDTQLFDDTVSCEHRLRQEGGDKDEVIEAAKKAHAHEFIENMPGGYDTPIGDIGTASRAAKRQRIVLARAISGDPAILILDEFTSQIDAESEGNIHAALKEFVKWLTEAGARTAHGRLGPRSRIRHDVPDHAPARPTLEIADRIVVMDAGKIVAVGTHPS